jgi:exonuclease SbcC
MKLNKISLTNVRSYESEEIEFPQGSTLLSGDIGSGKTSVLLAIEFALFGLQPGQRGASLLKNGKKEARVVMEFEVEPQQIIVERTIKKTGKTISQDYCAITVDNEKTECSVTELKDKVLQLLSYPREFAKKQNLLYKFTVYTPQEEMKQIILQDSVTRINTLRHVFGIDKYKTILENASALAIKLREEKRIKQVLTENLEQDRLEIIEKENELESKHYNLASVEKELFLKTDARKKIQEEKEAVSSKIEEKREFERGIDKSKLILSTKEEAVFSNKKLILSLQDQIKEIKSLEFDDSKIFELEQEIVRFKSNKKELGDKNLEITSQINSLNLKIQESNSTKNNIERMEICPTCLQDVDPNYKANVANRLDSTISENTNKIQTLQLEKKKIIENINKVDQDLSLREKELQDLKILKIKTQDITEKEIRAKELETSTFSLEKDIKMLNEQINTLKNSVFELSKYDAIFQEKNKELERALGEERIAEIKVVELKKEIEVFTRQIEELKEKIKKTQEIKKELEHITLLESWVAKKFTPLISFVERNVMAKLKAEFSKLFNEWFSMLVEGNFTASLNDDFTPIIEQQDYEIDYAYLSGGERTAVALAYRLALNQVINSLLGKIKTRDFIILDEPTDGFSDQQLDKMRDVLLQLNVAQLIIVSHEQKIESFVENIVRFRKEGGISKRV